MGKTLEKIVFKHVHNYLHTHRLISSFQSGFTPGDSTVYQLCELYHLFAKALDNRKDIRIVFCDISKAFDRVWHKGLIFKLKSLGVTGPLLEWFSNYLQERRQRVVLKGHHSDWGYITAGVPQGSVLGPLLFLIYINDIVDVVQSGIRLFADDTTLFVTSEDHEISSRVLNNDLESLSAWARQWLVTFSPAKTESMCITLRQLRVDHSNPLFFENQRLSSVPEHKHLGVVLTHNLSWSPHITQICDKAGRVLNLLSYFQYKLDRDTLETMYTSFVRPVLEYGCVVWSDCTQNDSDLLESVQKRAARIVSGGIRGTSTQVLYSELGWQSLKDRRDFHSLCLFYKINNQLCPSYLSQYLPEQVDVRAGGVYNLRNRGDLSIPRARTTLYQNSFFPRMTQLWNSLDRSISNSSSLAVFKKRLNEHTFTLPNMVKAIYASGERKANIIHARLRMKCSSLNGHLYSNHIVPNPRCSCGSPNEDTNHFFFICPYFHAHRRLMLAAIQQHCDPNLDILLHGNPEFGLDSNLEIFRAVQTYITASGRFN